MSPQLNEKLQKLLRLARGGVGGERENAEVILNRILQQNNLTIADIESKSVALRPVQFIVKDDWHYKLLCQIISAVTNRQVTEIYRLRTQKKDRYYCDLNPAWEAECLIMYSVLSRSLQEEMDVFYSAFVHKNHIFPETTPEKEAAAELSDEDRQRILRTRLMMEGIKKAQVHKQITGATS